MHTIHETLEFIVKSIIPNSDSITVDSKEEDGVVYLEVSAPSEVTGQIIGKEGRIIKSIRTLLNLSYPNLRYSLEIKN